MVTGVGLYFDLRGENVYIVNIYVYIMGMLLITFYDMCGSLGYVCNIGNFTFKKYS